MIQCLYILQNVHLRSLPNIRHHAVAIFFFLVMRTSMIYSLSNFQIENMV